MEQHSRIDPLRAAVRAAKANDQLVGCVMTMGALHAGHRSLLDAARRETDFVVATIFVNPTQFAPNEDLEKYPRPIEDDLAVCSDSGVDAVFLPSVEAMYSDDAQTIVRVSRVSHPLEGAHRPTHFEGVATVVLKLLNIVRPDIAYFGQKDYQQYVVIRQMVRDLNVPVDIKSVPTVRAPDGLALSSRNRYLSPKERRTALLLHEALVMAEHQLVSGIESVNDVVDQMRSLIDSGDDVAVDYVAIVDPDSLVSLNQPQASMVALVAVKVGTTRLIDNRIIELP